MRILADAFLVQIIRALNRKGQSILDIRCNQLDECDVLHTVAELLNTAGVVASVRLGKLQVDDVLAAQSWFERVAGLALPMTLQEVETWTSHCPGISVVTPADCLQQRIGNDGSMPCVRILPLNRDGRVSRLRHCVAVVTNHRSTCLLHVSDVPIASSVARALCVNVDSAINIFNNPRVSQLSHEAALLASIARWLSGKRPRANRRSLKMYGTAMAVARRERSANAGVANRLRLLEARLPSHVLERYPNGLPLDHLPQLRPVSLPAYTPLASRLATAVTRKSPASGQMHVVAYNTLTAQWAKGVSTCDHGARVPMRTTVTLMQRAMHVDLSIGLFVWVNEPTTEVEACCIPVQRYESPVVVCTQSTATQWVCVQDQRFPGWATQSQ
jgi:hypothetical protein